MDARSAIRFRFGVFEVDPRSGELRKAGSKVKVQEKPIQLLLLLLENPGEVVTRDQLRDALWPADTFVDFDHSLGTAVAKLRAALGDSAKNPRFVETVASRGYRFIAPVTADTQRPPDEALQRAEHAEPTPPRNDGTADLAAPLAPPDRPSTPTRRLPPAAALAAAAVIVLAIVVFGFNAGNPRGLFSSGGATIHSLAVLPLQNMSKDPSEEYFVDGMTEQLIATLAQLHDVEVISRTSAMQYKRTTKHVPEIGRELNADALIEGSVIRSGSRVRITAQLVDARTDQHLWARSYERNFDDVLALQNEIAAAIADEIRIRLSPEEKSRLAQTPTVSAAAQEAYLRARYHLNQGDEAAVRKSIDEFTAAIAADPGDARSHAGLSQAYIALTDFYERPAETMPRAKAAAETAVRLDDMQADAHASLGAVRFLYDWDWKGAEAEFRRALSLNNASPDAHVWYGVFLSQMGRFDEALTEIRRAEALDPLSVPVRINAGWVNYLARRNDAAIAEWKKALDIEPNLGVAHTSIWLAYVRSRASHDESPLHLEPQDDSPMNLATLAGVYAMSGKRAEAERVLAQVKELASHRYVCPYEVAVAHAALDQRDAALEWLRRGLDSRSVCMPDLKVDPRLDSLRQDPRFRELLRSVGFGDQ